MDRILHNNDHDCTHMETRQFPGPRRDFRPSSKHCHEDTHRTTSCLVWGGGGRIMTFSRQVLSDDRGPKAKGPFAFARVTRRLVYRISSKSSRVNLLDCTWLGPSSSLMLPVFIFIRSALYLINRSGAVRCPNVIHAEVVLVRNPARRDLRALATTTYRNAKSHYQRHILGSRSLTQVAC